MTYRPVRGSEGEAAWKPARIAPRGIRRFVRAHPGVRVIDRYAAHLEELFLLRNPRYRFDKNYRAALREFVKRHHGKAPLRMKGSWFYFSWLHAVLHVLPESMHQELRTGRNRNLVTSREQEQYYRAAVGVAGMSVGSHAALTIVMAGGARRIKLADPDTISGDNLNRIRTGFPNVGLHKAIAVARQIYEMNPYARVELFSEGVTEANMACFLDGLGVLVEEMDNPFLKLKIREEARRRRIPVVMAADNGDGVIADVERYDIQPRYPILHGILGRMKPEDVKQVPPQDLPRIIAKMAGADIANLRMLASVLEVGKTIYSWPQLGTAATMCGSVLAYLARRVALRDQSIHSGRYEVNPDAIFEKGYASRASMKHRVREREKLLRRMGIR